MKEKATVCPILATLIPPLAVAYEAIVLGADSIVIEAARLLNERTGQYDLDAAAWIKGDRIQEVGRPAVDIIAHAPADAKRINLSVCTLLPGLIRRLPSCSDFDKALFLGRPAASIKDFAHSISLSTIVVIRRSESETRVGVHYPPWTHLN